MRPTNLTNTYAYTKASASRLILPHLEPDGVPDRARTAFDARDTSILLELQQRGAIATRLGDVNGISLGRGGK